MKEATISRTGDRLAVHLFGEIDHHAAKKIREAVDPELFLPGVKILVLDFSGVIFMDSSGIGLILGRVDKAEPLGIKLVIQGLSGTNRRLIRMSGLEKLKSVSVI